MTGKHTLTAVAAALALAALFSPLGGLSPARAQGARPVATLPDAIAGRDYPPIGIGTGGVAPYTVAVTFGDLPGGMAVTSSGLLSGRPATAGTYLFALRISDASSPPQIAEQVFRLRVVAPGSGDPAS